MNWKVLGAGAAIVVPLVAVLASGFGIDPRGVSNALEGTPAAHFDLLDLNGQEVDIADAAGHPMVINFWATWCVPCAQEHSDMMQAARTYGPRGVVFLGVLYGDEPAAARSYLARHGQAFPTLIDPGNRTAIDYGVGGVPETFIVDKDGVIVRKFSGPIRFGTIAQELEPLL